MGPFFSYTQVRVVHNQELQKAMENDKRAGEPRKRCKPGLVMVVLYGAVKLIGNAPRQQRRQQPRFTQNDCEVACSAESLRA